MKYAYYPFPYGVLKIGYEEGAVTSLSRQEEESADGEPSALSDRAHKEIMEYLAGERRAFDFPMRARGTAFQEKVWRALAEIPYGETRTYGQIAAAVGNPKASRAVGMANNKNPIWIAIPCHRVVGTNGALVGYAGGLEMKEALLALERANAGKAR
jgi:O-6-methylguanine DNA methyltransferase